MPWYQECQKDANNWSPVGLEQLDTETAHEDSEQSEANHGDDHARQHGGPEPNASQQRREGQEHGQGRDDIPEGVPRMISYFFLRLLLDIQPYKSQKRDKRECRDETTKLVASLRKFRYEYDNRSG